MPSLPAGGGMSAIPFEDARYDVHAISLPAKTFTGDFWFTQNPQTFTFDGWDLATFTPATYYSTYSLTFTIPTSGTHTMQITGLDGQTRQISVTALPLYAHEGEFVGALVVFWEH